jgi:hypothetical protein
MNDRTALPSSPQNMRILWWGWIAPPIWWLAQFEVRYATVLWACHHGYRWLVLGIGFLALFGSSALALQVWRLERQVNGEESHGFLQQGAQWSTVFFALLVLAQILPDLFLGPCDS